MSRTPFFQVMFSLQNIPTEDIELPGLTLQRWSSTAGLEDEFDLTLEVASDPTA